MNEKMAGVTVAQLLDHTAGLPANVDWWEFDRSGKSTSEQRLNIAKQVLSTSARTGSGKQACLFQRGLHAARDDR